MRVSNQTTWHHGCGLGDARAACSRWRMPREGVQHHRCSTVAQLAASGREGPRGGAADTRWWHRQFVWGCIALRATERSYILDVYTMRVSRRVERASPALWNTPMRPRSTTVAPDGHHVMGAWGMEYVSLPIHGSFPCHLMCPANGGTRIGGCDAGGRCVGRVSSTGGGSSTVTSGRGPCTWRSDCDAETGTRHAPF
jgi:hypothetical protein